MALALAFSAARPSGPAGMRVRDFEAYYAAGVSFNAGLDPYGRDIWQSERGLPGVDGGRDELLPFVGPPFSLALWSLFGRLGYPFASGLWTGVAGLAAVAFVLATLRLAGGPFAPLDVGAALLLGASFAPLTSGLALGQVAVLSCAGIAGALLALERRAILPGFAAGLVAALQPNLAIVLAARLGSPRAALALGGAALGALALSLAFAGGFGGWSNYLATLAAHATAERFAAIQVTPAAVLAAFGVADGPALVLGLALSAGVVLALALQCASGRYAPLERGALACAAFPLALPFAHEHDLALVLLPAALCARRCNGRALLAGAIGTVLVAVDWLGLAERHASAAGTLAALACASAAIALRPAPQGAQVAAGIVALGALVMGSLATGHELAVWPDALPARFHADAGLGAAAVWHLEQQLAGVMSLDPYLGLLRLLSLAGCALLWFSLTSLARRSEPSSTPPRPPAATYPSG